MALDFGVEIECLIPGREGWQRQTGIGVAQSISDTGIGCNFVGYSHARTSDWKVVTDSSLSPPSGYVGLELVSPPLNDMGINQIDTVCNTVKNLGARTNRSCGLHVHIGARHLSVPVFKRLAFLYLDNEEVIDSLMPPSRRGDKNDYCYSLKSSNKEKLEQANTVEEISKAIRMNSALTKPSRYVKLNFTSYWKHGTVEFRQHSGTIDPVKIKKWIFFCQKMVDVATSGQPVRQSVVNQDAALARRIQRARQLRLIYEMVSREEGATSVEVQVVLNRRTPPALASDLTRLGVSFQTAGRRNGHIVYKITRAIEPATLTALLNKLELEEEDRQFWQDRHNLLSNIVTAVGHEDND